ncbi:DUF1330 domain-containing protein [Nonomuraea sp. NPDC049725]|uniref:DUF1330 domain-containing protein n=1 Tax=Nonomuraea sp. NPDC049725 TaxID=3154508 RepID=UPI0034259128
MPLVNPAHALPPAPPHPSSESAPQNLPNPPRPVDAYEAGIAERVVLIEFDSFEQAVAARASAAYQKALAELPDGFERDFRIIEGLD